MANTLRRLYFPYNTRIRRCQSFVAVSSAKASEDTGARNAKKDEVEQNVSKIREKKRGDLDKRYRCSDKTEVELSPLISQRREAIFVKGRAADRASAHAIPQHESPKSGHHPNHTSVSHRDPSSGEFKKKNIRISATEDVDGCSSAPRPTN
jgi:hypothetical protein